MRRGRQREPSQPTRLRDDEGALEGPAACLGGRFLEGRDSVRFPCPAREAQKIFAKIERV